MPVFFDFTILCSLIEALTSIIVSPNPFTFIAVINAHHKFIKFLFTS